MNLLISIVLALTITLVLEIVFSLTWGLRKQQLWMVVLMNILTNPAANTLYSFMTVYLGWPRLLPAILLEFAVVVVEGLCCRDFMEKPWSFVVLANIFSYTAGLLLQIILLGGIP